MRIQHNIMAMNAYRNYTNNTSALSKNLEKLSSGYKINRAGDDAAGLAISEKMRAQITGLDVAQKNAKDGISLVQTAEGALTEVHDMLNRMYELAEQSANGTYEKTDRDQLQKEFDRLTEEIDRIADSTNFNGIRLLDGSLGGYKGDIAANVAGVIQKGGVTVSGGDLSGNDTVKLKIAKDTGAISLSELKYTDNGGTQKTVAAADFAAKGIEFKADANNPDAATAGIYKFTVTVDPTKATADEYNKLNGIEITVKLDGVSTAADNEVTFTLAADGTGSGLNLQIGDTGETFNRINVAVSSIKADKLSDMTQGTGKVLTDLNISTEKGAVDAMKSLRGMIDYVSDVRGGLGATQNRLDHTINNLSVMEENIQDAESTIRDTDVADEMMAYTKNNILIQSAQAMLAQANQVPQGVLQLLQ